MEEKEAGEKEDMEEAEDRGKSSHDAAGAVESESVEDNTAGNNEQEEVRLVEHEGRCGRGRGNGCQGKRDAGSHVYRLVVT